MKNREYYLYQYMKVVDEMLQQEGKTLADEWYSDEVSDFLNADEVVGYYFYFYDDEAFNTWLENSEDLPLCEQTEQDIEVTEIFSELYGK